MNDTKGLEFELIVECNRPKRNEPYIAWLKSVIALAVHANQRLKELEA